VGCGRGPNGFGGRFLQAQSGEKMPENLGHIV